MPTDEEIYKLLNADNMRKLLCTVKEPNITYSKHSLLRLKLRSKYNDFIPTDTKEFKKMIINRYPTHVDFVPLYPQAARIRIEKYGKE